MKDGMTYEERARTGRELCGDKGMCISVRFGEDTAALIVAERATADDALRILADGLIAAHKTADEVMAQLAVAGGGSEADRTLMLKGLLSAGRNAMPVEVVTRITALDGGGGGGE